MQQNSVPDSCLVPARALKVFGPECVKVAIPFGIERGWTERNIETRRMGRQTDRQRQFEPFGQPSGEADVVGMKMRGDQTRQSPAGQWPGVPVDCPREFRNPA